MVFAVISGLIASQWKLWIAHKLAVTHDSAIWFGIFSYFVDSLHRGFFPFWNPYMNCGELFFLNINVLHLLDPSTILLILIGKLLKTDLFTLYQYDLLVRYIIFICGCYLFFRYVSKYKISALIAFITITFSTCSISYLRQHAFLLAFYLIPWILLYILKFLEQRQPKFLVFIAFFLGIAFYSYQSMFIICSASILLLTIFLTKGLDKFKLKTFSIDSKFALGAFFIFFLLVLNLLPAYFTYKFDVVPLARIYEAPAGAHSFIPDFFNLLTPYWIILHFFNWNFMSESFLYIGLLPLLFLVLGLCFSKHKYKPGFILTAVIIALLMLGEKFMVYPLFNKFFPFFSIIRNMHTFGFFFIFCLAFLPVSALML